MVDCTSPELEEAPDDRDAVFEGAFDPMTPSLELGVAASAPLDQLAESESITTARFTNARIPRLPRSPCPPSAGGASGFTTIFMMDIVLII
jgi:hypothetical protein